MSNNKLPKEIYLLGQDLEYMVEDSQKDLYHIDASLMDVLGRQVKYLSEESVKEMLAEKDIYLEHSMSYQKQLLELNEKLKNDLAEKDKRISELVELAKLGQNELYLIWSDYVDKPHAKYNSYYLFKADEVLNRNKKD